MRLDAVREMCEIAGRSHRGAAARAARRGNQFRRQESNRHWTWRLPRSTARIRKARLDAIATLSKSVSQDVRNRLALLLDKSPDGSFAESDEKVRQAAAAAVNYDRPLAHFLLRHRDAFFWPQPGVGAGSDRHRTGHHVRRHGRHQHGSRRADDARRVHHLRRPDGDAGTHRHLDPGGDSSGVYRVGSDGRC